MTQSNKTVAVKGTYCLMEAMVQQIQPWIDSTDYKDLIVNIQMEGHKIDEVGMVLDDGNGLLRYIMHATSVLNEKEREYTAIPPKGMKENIPALAIVRHVRSFGLPPALAENVAAIIPTIMAETENGTSINTYKVGMYGDGISLFIFNRAHPVLKIVIKLRELANYVRLLDASLITADSAHKHVSDSLSSTLG